MDLIYDVNNLQILGNLGEKWVNRSIKNIDRQSNIVNSNINMGVR